VHSHPGVFLTGVTSYLLLPLAALGFPRAWRRHSVFAVWALVGVVFLLSWSTKWPHYLLLVLPALAVCAGEAPATLLTLLRRGRNPPAQNTPG
jgi:4-amino-4-deoxy-L-arabinose transferase-like glycosyltransferase